MSTSKLYIFKYVDARCCVEPIIGNEVTYPLQTFRSEFCWYYLMSPVIPGNRT